MTKNNNSRNALPATATASTPLLGFHSPPQHVFWIPEKPDATGLARLRYSASKSNKDSPLEHCSPTAQVQLQIYNQSLWILQSLDEDGNQKTIGGDEFYITYKDYGNPKWFRLDTDITGVALQTDLGNGRYLLDFGQPPMTNIAKKQYESTGSGSLMVHFQYTCGIGRMSRPEKDQWIYGGQLRHAHKQLDVPAPVIRPFQNVNPVDLSHYQAVVCFGDSVVGNFCGCWWGKLRYKLPNVHCEGKIGSEVALETVDAYFENLQKAYGELLEKSKSNTTALLLGAAVWDILEPTRETHQGRSFDNHIQACRIFIEKVQTRYPNVTIVWKSPQAFHPHVLTENCFKKGKCQDRTKYMSSSNVYHLYVRQKALMNELDITFIDIYEATYLSGNWMMDGDGRHYRQWLNQAMVSWSYPGWHDIYSIKK
jgi:hypothetical protein